jgi:YjbE family integral membrane protein
MDFEALGALAEVTLINVVLSADNVMVIGLAAMGLAPAQRARAVWLGISLSATLLAGFAVIATALLKVLGLLAAGGLLLLWVAWKLWRDLNHAAASAAGAEQPARKSLWQALWQIVAADVSVSLDNVLAIAGAAHDHPRVMVSGLACSVVLMGFASTLMARLLARYRWIAHAGLAVIVFVAVRMIWIGSHDVLTAIAK